MLTKKILPAEVASQLKCIMLVVSFMVFTALPCYAMWYGENVGGQSDIIMMDIRWPYWTETTYYAHWNSVVAGGEDEFSFYGGYLSNIAAVPPDFLPDMDPEKQDKLTLGSNWAFWGTNKKTGEPPRVIATSRFNYPHQYIGEGGSSALYGDEGVEYVGSVEADAVIPQGGSLVFTKVAGPPWLEIAADGTLSGIGRHVNTGLNSFTVRATGDEGTYAEAELQITVLDTFSGELGLSDFVGLAYYWLESECVGEPLCAGADLSGDGNVNSEDLLMFAQGWLVDRDTNSCHVQSIVVDTTPPDTWGRRRGIAEVTVYDKCLNPLADAEVRGVFSGSYTDEVTAITDSDGVAVMTTSRLISDPSFTFCVEGIDAPGYTYMPDNSRQTCGNY